MSKNNSHQAEQVEDTDVPIRLLIYGIVVALLIQFSAGIAVYFWIDSWEGRASFGEMFGVVNTFFSGLALAGVIYTIYLQRRDLQLQRRELEMTRDELKRTALAQEKSELALVAQARLMELTAKLTATNFLAEAYRNKLDLLEKQGREYSSEQDKWNEIMRNLEELTVKLGSDFNNTPPNNSFNPTAR